MGDFGSNGRASASDHQAALRAEGAQRTMMRDDCRLS
jgi:hypothetical protein